jgi:hypothetical protein
MICLPLVFLNNYLDPDMNHSMKNKPKISNFMFKFPLLFRGYIHETTPSKFGRNFSRTFFPTKKNNNRRGLSVSEIYGVILIYTYIMCVLLQK